jgi:predicted methyltransferase
MIVLSHFQVAPLLKAKQAGQPMALISPDLGLTQVEATLEASSAVFPGGERLSWEAAAKITDSPNNCFALENDRIRAIQAFSEHTSRAHSLMPTAGAPTLLIAGFPMHRIKGTDPHRDTLSKIKAVAPVVGQVLDTTTGLGYTAIEAGKTADHVTTIELDPTTLEIARQNPWSQALFGNPKITQIAGDSFDEVANFPDNYFSRILHDPPTFALAGDLYSGEFYRQLYRVLKRNGRLFHYIGDLESKSGSNTARGVVRRLGEAGFTRIIRRQEAFGVVAYK